MATATDTFTGTNGVAISSRAGDTGHTWSQVLAGGSLQINGDRAFAVGNGTEARYLWSFVPAGTDWDLTISVDFLSTTGQVLIGGCFCMNVGGTTGFQIALNGFSDTLTITDIGPDVEEFSTAWSAADQVWLLERRGNTVTVKRDGSTLTTIDVTGYDNRFGAYKYSEVSTSDFFMLQGVTVSDVTGGSDPEPNCYVMTAGGLAPCVSRVMTSGGLFPPLA